jgi:two-component system sensor histidine kinase KdpD
MLRALVEVVAVLALGCLGGLSGLALLHRRSRVRRDADTRRVGDRPSVAPDTLRTIYHELRSPITSVGALARACGHLDRLTPEARSEALDLIARHAEQLTAILDDVRELADCVSSNRASGSTCSVREVVRTSAACAGLPSDRLRVEVADDASFVRTSATALSRILVNLLQNAARYGPPDAPVLVRARRCDRARRTEVSVIDAGSGPGDDARAAPAEAMGLGSHIVDELAASLGGAVIRQSTPIGYAVAVRLPDAAIGPPRPPAGP